MARPKGALNKRTRAALSAAAEGKLGGVAEKTLTEMLELANDKTKDLSVRMRAAEIVLPYCKPRLAAIEQTTIEPRDKVDPAELQTKLTTKLVEKPELLEQMISAAVATAPELRGRLLRLLEQLAPAPSAGNVLQLVQ